MIVVRDVFQAKYGKGGELVTLLKETHQAMGAQYAVRVMTDASGPFFTVVTETDLPSLGDWEKTAQQIFSHPDFAGWFERMVPLVDSGRREFYTIE